MSKHSLIPNLTPTALQTLSKPPAAGRYSCQPPARRASNFKPPAPGALRPGRPLPVGHKGSPRGPARLGPPEPRGAVRGMAEGRGKGSTPHPAPHKMPPLPGPPRPPPEKPRPQAGHWWEGGRAANGRRHRPAEGWRREAARDGLQPLGVGPRCEGAQRSAPSPQHQRRCCPLLRQPGGGSKWISRCFSLL